MYVPAAFNHFHIYCFNQSSKSANGAIVCELWIASANFASDWQFKPGLTHIIVKSGLDILMGHPSKHST